MNLLPGGAEPKWWRNTLAGSYPYHSTTPRLKKIYRQSSPWVYNWRHSVSTTTAVPPVLVNWAASWYKSMNQRLTSHLPLVPQTPKAPKLPEPSKLPRYCSSTLMQIIGSIKAPYKLFLPPEMIPSDSWDGALCYRIKDDFIGVAEFSAPQGCIILPDQLMRKYNFQIGQDIGIVPASLPKGSRVTLRAQDLLDWKHVLEQYLPQNYTTLQQGQELTVEYNGTHNITVEHCEPEQAICIIDTDLDLELDAPPQQPQTTVGYGTWPLGTVPTTIKEPGLVKVEGLAFVGPEHSTSNESYLYRVVDSLELPTTENHEEGSIVGLMAICGQGTFTLSSSRDRSREPKEPGEPGEPRDSFANTQCPTCGKDIPPQSMVLHQAFCARNTVKCPKCSQTFSQKIPENHWHCDECGHIETSDFYDSHAREHQYETCGCGFKSLFGQVAFHRASTCPNRLHICRFCHLLVPQGEETPLNRIQGYSEHEAACGTKTTNCPRCNKVVMLRALAPHLLHHEQVRIDRSATSPTLCANINCPNLVAAPGAPVDESRLGLCSGCYGIVHVPQHDPDLSKLRSRIERRYLIQLTRGCGNSWCANTHCASGTGLKVPFKEGMTQTKQLMDALADSGQVFLCVDRNASRKALFLSDEMEFSREWKGMAISVCSSEADARTWLVNNAPRIDGT